MCFPSESVGEAFTVTEEKLEDFSPVYEFDVSETCELSLMGHCVICRFILQGAESVNM